MIYSMITTDVFDTYTYFYIDEKTKHGFLIDPAAESQKLLHIIAENGWTIEKILLTHGHFDHTGAVDELYKLLQIPYFIHEKGKRYLEDNKWNLSAYCKRNVILNDALYLRDGEVIRLSENKEFKLQVIYTPGHTSDSVMYFSKIDKVAFVGDTIFKGTIGSTQYVGSSVKDLQDSILNRIFTLPQEIILYPGHSKSTTIGTEKARYTR